MRYLESKVPIARWVLTHEASSVLAVVATPMLQLHVDPNRRGRTMSTSEKGQLARKTWRTVEPLHAMIYFVPEAASFYESLGITGRNGYFASRSAPMGAVSAEVVIATFYNFSPELVRRAIPISWDVATPEVVMAARLQAVDASMRRLLGEPSLGSPEMIRAAELARIAACEACIRTEGRPLAAGHAGLDWPDEPHLALWHAQSILREYRGDGHVALLVALGLSGIEALVSHAATGDASAQLLRSTRGWSIDEWAGAVESMRSRGWLTGTDELVMTDLGRAERGELEDQTDELAAAPYDALGEEACQELRGLVRPWSKVLAEVLFR